MWSTAAGHYWDFSPEAADSGSSESSSSGHALAGVLLVLSLVYFLYLDRTGYSTGVQWLAGLLLLLGIMAQSGHFFVHLALGQKNRSSLGTIMTRTGALLIASALIVLAIGLL